MKQKTLQEQYNLIKEGKGNKEVFVKSAKTQFPSIIRNAATLNETVSSLKRNHIISENVLGAGMISSQNSTSTDWFEIFNTNLETIAEEAKAVEKKATKDVVDLETKGYDYKVEDDANNMNFEEFLSGYYTEMKNPKNADKTEQELKDIVKKNLEKNALHYVENGQFGVDGIGYTDQHPGLKASDTDQMTPVKLKEGRVTKADWEKMNDDEKEMALLSAYEDPDEAIKYIDSKYEDLGSIATQNMRIDEMKTSIEDEDRRALADIGTLMDVGVKEEEAIEIVADQYKLSSSYLAKKMLNEDKRTDAEEEGYLDGMRDEKEDIEAEESKPKAKKAKKETTESKLAEIDKNGKIATLEMQIEALEEIIESKTQRISSITEDENMSELMDKKKVKALQKEIKVLEGRKSKMEKMYEKMCGKKYRQQEIVGETKNEE